MPNMPYPRNTPDSPFTSVQKTNRYSPSSSAVIQDPGNNFTHDISATGGIATFLKCPRCFWLKRRDGWDKPGTPSFRLNERLDELMRGTFEAHRNDVPPSVYPALAAAGYNAPPWEDPAECLRLTGDAQYREKVLGEWVNPTSRTGNKSGWRGARLVGHLYGPNNELNVYGELDEICVMPNGELLVVDFKGKYSDDSKLQDLSYGYNVWLKIQMDVYAWLLEKHGFQVYSEAIILQMNAQSSTQTQMSDGKIEFRPIIVPHTLDTTWINAVLDDILVCLASATPPAPGIYPKPTRANPANTVDCDYCVYRDVVPS